MTSCHASSRTAGIATLMLAALGLTQEIAAQSIPMRLNAPHTTIGFTVEIMGGLTEVDGRFDRFQGVVQYDTSEVVGSTVSVWIEAASINTGNTNRDNHLRTDDFLDVERHPQLRFEGRVVAADGDRWLLRGSLTIAGVTDTVTIPFRRRHVATLIDIDGTPGAIFEGHIAISREQYGIKATTRWNRPFAATGELAMGDEIAITLRVVALTP